MTDIIERAEAAIAAANVHGWLPPSARQLVPELLTELKAARAENEQLRDDCQRWRNLFDRVNGIGPEHAGILRNLAEGRK